MAIPTCWHPGTEAAAGIGNDVAVSDTDQATTELDVAAAEEAIAGGAELIDVRTAYEFEGGHIPGARNVELNDVPAAAESLPRDGTIVFSCRSGNRSSMAVAALREAGFEAFNIAGGLQAWVDADKPVDPPDGTVRAPLPPS